MDSAIVYAQNGDAIYLPGGAIAGSASLTIKNKVSIYGAGYRVDSSAVTQPTYLYSDIIFALGSEGSFLTGVSDAGSGISLRANNVTISRCIFYTLGITAFGCLIEDNIIYDVLMGDGSIKSNMIRKNILYGGLIQNTQGWTFKNNIFIVANKSYLAYGLTNCSFYNNIFYNDNVFNPLFFTGGAGLNISNNLFTTNAGYVGNKVQVIDSIFINYTKSKWDLFQNFKLQTRCIGLKYGNDGTDVGIYGTANPFKYSGLPINPHYQAINIPVSTDANGKLNVNITVAAQNQ